MILDAQRRSPTVLCSGFVALDVVKHRGQIVAHRAGGTAANVAANLAFLGWHAEVAGRIGRDRAGKVLRDDLSRSHVLVTNLHRESTLSTPLVLHEVVQRGHRFRFSCPVCGRRFPRYQPLAAEDIPSVLKRRPSVLFIDRANSATALLAEHFRDAGALVVFEPSTPGDSGAFTTMVQLAHIVKYSRERLSGFRATLAAMTRRQDQLWISTAGAAGSRYWLKGRWHEVDAYPTRSIDAGGAGDWMTAGILAGLPGVTLADLDQEAIGAAIQFGQALAAVSCAFLGARGLSSHSSATQARAWAVQLIQDGAALGPRPVGAMHKPVADSGCVGCLRSEPAVP